MEPPARTVYRFGPFELDTAAGELLKQGSPVSLQEQPFRLLVILLESSDKVVTRAEIQSRIWEENTFVDFDSSLRVAVGKLRTALGDDAANPRYIETIPKRGYRFLGPATQSTTQPANSVHPTITAETSPAETPARTGRLRTGRSRRWAIGAVSLLLAAIGAAAFLFVFRGKKLLTERDTVVLADFTNTTGDPVFDETLRQGMTIELEQSPFLSLVSEGRIQHTLGLMGQPVNARLTPEIARELCERTGSAAVLDGSIAGLGSQYVLGLRARSCATGDVLAEEQTQAARKEDVLNALSSIANKFRVRLGESLRTVQQHNAPLAEATTPSLEALKAYTAGARIAFASGGAAAAPFFKSAIEIDPKFAMAYSVLGQVYGNIGESELSAESETRAYELRDRASDEERYWISSSYDKQVTGNLQKADQTCELWMQAYPRAIEPHGFLSGNISLVRGNYEKAVEEAKIALGIDPDFGIGYSNLVVSDLALDRIEDAENTLRQASERKLEIPDFVIQRYMIAFFKGDKAGMEREVSGARGRIAAEEWMANSEGFVLAYAGRLQEARTKSSQAENFARQADRSETEALYETDAALREALFGNAAAARQSAMAALQLSHSRDVEYGAAAALAISGESSRSQGLAENLSERFPEDTKVRFAYTPTLLALLALNHNTPSKAIELLQTAISYEDGVRSSGSEVLIGAGTLYPAYVRGEAYLVAHQGREAAQEFQKILDHHGIVLSDPIGALAHLQLGRAYALAGDKDKARTAYRDFLTLWRNADSNIPLLKNAKGEYLSLQ
jgi:DNA-binding winged helix-turn-helix (wHTH) protein/tetratricopeptide (TPR) repeat protein